MSTPAPIPGGAGTIGSYQQQYLFAYILNKPPSFLPLYNSMIDNPNAPAALLPLISASPLAFADRVKLLNDLFNAGAPVDPFIEGGAGYVDPYTIMAVRENQNWAYVMPGTGLIKSANVMGMGNSLPAPPGAILTTTNIADLPPFPVIVPPPPAPPVSSTKLALPVGKRFTFSAVTAIGDLFSPLVDPTGSDGYIDGDTWQGKTAQGYSGAWEKVPGSFGMGWNWQKIS